MPATLTIDRNILTVDQSLVDIYLARVDRFVKNVRQFEQQLKDATDAVKEHFVPDQKAQPDIQHREPVAAKSEPAVVTAADIDIDALLNGVDIGGMTI